MNWGPNLDKPYLSFKLAHIWFVWTFLAKNKIGMLNFDFGDHLVTQPVVTTNLCCVAHFPTCYILKLHICPMIRDVISLMLVGEMHIGPQASKRVATY